jgi:DNA polymerase III subunit delta
MVALRESDLGDVLGRRASKLNGVLFYGNDEAAISTAVRQSVARLGGGEEPLRIDGSALKSDPAMLDDGFRAMSLLGDRRLIVVSGVDENHASHVSGVIAAAVLGNFVVLAAAALKKDSKLRGLADASQNFASMGFYEESGAALIVRAQTIAKAQGMAFETGAVERFVDLCGNDRSFLFNEAEKLTLYCYPETRITVSDVEAVCGDQASFESDTLIAAVLDGDEDRVDRIFAAMVLGGDAKSVLIMLQMALTRLEAVSAAMARGMDLAAACRAARPPIYEKQQAMAGRQLRVFSGDALGRAQVTVQQAMLQARQMSDLGDAITGRCLMSLARMARQSRARASG